MAKYSTLIAVLFVFTACGGGGGSLVGAAPTPENVLAQQMFEGCGVDGLTVYRLVEEQPIALLESGSAIPPSIFVTEVSTQDAYFIWQTNLDLDIPIDFEVRTEFKDANGDPMLPTDMQTYVTILHGDLLDAWTLLPSMPPGSMITHTISTPKAQPGEPIIDAVITHGIGVNGALVTTSGDYTADDGLGCVTTLHWENLALQLPAYQQHPVQGTMELDYMVALDNLTGTIDYNGVLPADLELSINGGGVHLYDYDPATDAVSPK
ncbi:MAG: hypothetical protein QNJ98_08405 [Planctomycetota bacterium]|nr:hypothetical protein [Planctomycetota bacterium]